MPARLYKFPPTPKIGTISLDHHTVAILLAQARIRGLTMTACWALAPPSPGHALDRSERPRPRRNGLETPYRPDASFTRALVPRPGYPSASRPRIQRPAHSVFDRMYFMAARRCWTTRPLPFLASTTADWDASGLEPRTAMGYESLILAGYFASVRGISTHFLTNSGMVTSNDDHWSVDQLARGVSMHQGQRPHDDCLRVPVGHDP